MINLRKIAIAGVGRRSGWRVIVPDPPPTLRPMAGAMAAGVGAGVGLGAATGLAIAATAAPAYDYSDCYFARQPVYDPYGNFVGYRRVRGLQLSITVLQMPREPPGAAGGFRLYGGATRERRPGERVRRIRLGTCFTSFRTRSRRR